MKYNSRIWFGVLALAFCEQSGLAQFDSGSDGSMGALVVDSNTTLAVPEDGRFHYTTIDILAGNTLTFTRNANNTPVWLLATGAITVAGDINADGTQGTSISGGVAGPGGFDGGNPGSAGTPPGDGQGPGGGGAGPGSTTLPESAGAGGFGAKTTIGASQNHGPAYGNPLNFPPIGGSGGGGTTGNPGRGGGAGGGAIVIASNVSIDVTTTSADIAAEGGREFGGAWNGGSGGSIRLVAPKITGRGRLWVRGGNNDTPPGRIRIDMLDRSGFNMVMTPASTASVGSLMVVDPDPLPRLDIVIVAGTPVAEGSGPVTVLLPFGSSPNQTITVQATDFNAVVPIRVVLTPDSGDRQTFEAEIDNISENPASTTIDVTVPVNVQNMVHVFTL